MSADSSARDRVASVLREVFGDVSDDDAEAGEPDGLHHVHGFLAPAQQKRVLEAIDAEGWLMGGLNQAMCFGNLPSWASELAGTLPTHLLAHKAGMPPHPPLHSEEHSSTPCMAPVCVALYPACPPLKCSCNMPHDIAGGTL